MQQNLLADESRLFIFSDAAKDPSQQVLVDEVRVIIKQVDGFKSVELIEPGMNIKCSTWTAICIPHPIIGEKNTQLVKLRGGVDITVHNCFVITKLITCRFDGYSKVTQGCP